MLELLNSRALLSAITNSSKEVAVLFGSPLSSPDGTSNYGVPDVNGVVELIGSYVESKGLYEEYENYVQGLNDTDKYQKSFSFVKGWLGQDAVNEIIKSAVLKSVYSEKSLNSPDKLNKDIDAWYLPSATKELGLILSKNNIVSGPALTTNFDPLMSISINKSGGQSYQTILHSDGTLNQSRSVAANSIQVVHLHGYWYDSETLHTPDQLNAERPKLKSSLANLLKDRALLVIGYGGWDDVFTQVLAELMNDDDAKLDIMWAFYESDSSLVNDIYKRLINNVKPAIIKGRFRAYGGINCHEFLKKLENEISKVNIINKGNSNVDENFLTVDDPNLKKEIKTKSIVEWSYYPEIAHKFVRETELHQFYEIYSKHSIINLAAEWGMARKQFLSTFLSKLQKTKNYYVDLEGSYSKDDALSAIKEQLNVEILQLVKEISQHKSVLIFDNIGNDFSKDQEFQFFHVILDLSKAITEFSSNIKVILGSLKGINVEYNARLCLNKLEDFDIKKYVESHSQDPISPCNKELLAKISRLSDGIPMLIDRVLSELKFVSIDEIIESDIRPESFEEFSGEPVPKALVTMIDQLKNSDSGIQKHAFNLLKVLSVLSYGDTFSNIKRIFPTKPFHPTHFQVLHDLDFLKIQKIETSELEVKQENEVFDSKLLIVPTLIREYVFSKLSQSEVMDILKRAADNHFGLDWTHGVLKLCSTDNLLLSEKNQHGGSAIVILTHLLRCAVESKNSNLLRQVLSICISFSMLLRKKSKYRELNSFCLDIRNLIKEVSEDINIDKIMILHGVASRMLGLHDEAIEIMLPLSLDVKSLNNKDKCQLFINLAFAYQSIKDSYNAELYATKVKDFSTKGDASYQQAESILISIKGINVKNGLTEIEKKARTNNNIITANNVALDIANQVDDRNQKLSCFTRVLNSDGDVYNKLRAITDKYNLLISEGGCVKINEKDIALVYTSYLFCYNQRMDALFNKAHRVVWNVFLTENNVISLVKLFRLSSLYWRIVGNKKMELKYARELKVLVSSLLPEYCQLPETRYVQLRIKTIA